jgi:hypothetical protein
VITHSRSHSNNDPVLIRGRDKVLLKGSGLDEPCL